MFMVINTIRIYDLDIMTINTKVIEWKGSFNLIAEYIDIIAAYDTVSFVTTLALWNFSLKYTSSNANDLSRVIDDSFNWLTT